MVPRNSKKGSGRIQPFFFVEAGWNNRGLYKPPMETLPPGPTGTERTCEGEPALTYNTRRYTQQYVVHTQVYK